MLLVEVLYDNFYLLYQELIDYLNELSQVWKKKFQRHQSNLNILFFLHLLLIYLSSNDSNSDQIIVNLLSFLINHQLFLNFNLHVRLLYNNDLNCKQVTNLLIIISLFLYLKFLHQFNFLMILLIRICFLYISFPDSMFP